MVNSILTSEPNFDFKNGREFTRRFCNHSWFLNGTRTEIFIDGAGERVVTMLVRDLNVSTGKFEVGFWVAFARSNGVEFLSWL